MTLAIILIIIGFICIAAVGIGATIIQNNDQKKIIKVPKDRWYPPNRYQFGNYTYWVDNDGHHNYSHIWGIDEDTVINEQSMRSNDPKFKELNDLYYKAIGHTPQWLRDERKNESFIRYPQPPKKLYYLTTISQYIYRTDDNNCLYIDDQITGEREIIDHSSLYTKNKAFYETHKTVLTYMYGNLSWLNYGVLILQ